MPTFNLLNAIRNHCSQCKCVYLSSAAVYGNPKVLPIKEEHDVSPISPYGYHKLHAEAICREFADLYQLPIVVARIFSAYGNGLKKQLLWDISSKVKQGKEVELFGTGEETRDFIHIYDLAKAIKIIVKNPISGFQIFNIANGKQIKVKELASLLVSQYSPNLKIKFNGQSRPGDPKFWEADISEIKTLGYQQQVNIFEGVNAYAKWFLRYQ